MEFFVLRDEASEEDVYFVLALDGTANLYTLDDFESGDALEPLATWKVDGEITPALAAEYLADSMSSEDSDSSVGMYVGYAVVPYKRQEPMLETQTIG